MLIAVQSVGPKVALAVLSGGPPRDLLAALAAADTARLQAAPGVGKRTAERIVVELREKVGASATVPPSWPRSAPRIRARSPATGCSAWVIPLSRSTNCSTARRATGPRT